MAGEKEELLQLLAASIYDYSKMHKLAFEDALKEISDEWDEMREKKATCNAVVRLLTLKQV